MSPFPLPISCTVSNAHAVGFEFDGLAGCTSDDLSAILDLVALASILPPFDVVISLGMNFDLAADADLVTELTVRFHGGRVEVPVFADFDFFEDIDTIFAAVAAAAFGHVCKPVSPL